MLLNIVSNIKNSIQQLSHKLTQNLLCIITSILAIKKLKNKICIKMRGNLGNQMFIYATAKNLKKYFPHKKHLYDISQCNYCLDKFGINLKTSKVYYEKYLLGRYKTAEKEFGIYDKTLFSKPPIFFKGYFQCEKYFKEYLLNSFKSLNFRFLNTANIENI